jgi:hypothetical protein
MFFDNIKNFLNQIIKKKKTVELKKSETVNSVILSLIKDRKDRINNK